jgi:hypothetical protein
MIPPRIPHPTEPAKLEKVESIPWQRCVELQLSRPEAAIFAALVRVALSRRAESIAPCAEVCRKRRQKAAERLATKIAVS